MRFSTQKRKDRKDAKKNHESLRAFAIFAPLREKTLFYLLISVLLFTA